MLGSNVIPIHPRESAVLTTRLVERFDDERQDVGIVRTEPRDLAPVIPLPVRMHDNRVIEPVDVPVGTRLAGRRGGDPESHDPGPLARALMAVEDATGR